MKKLIATLLILLMPSCLVSCGDPATTIFNAEKYSKVSAETLVSELGEPDTKDPYPLNGYQLTLYAYNTDSAYIEFILKNDEVVRIHYFSNDPISFSSDDDLYSIFGITPGGNISQTKDTGTVVEYQSINNKVGGLTIQDITDGSFKTAYITFNWKYFG